MGLAKVGRFYKIVKVMLEYGLDEDLPHNRYTRAIRYARKLAFWIKNKHPNESFATRLRLSLQDLGPVWIKLGQMMSTRRDLFPPDIADQLAFLQDQVDPFPGDIARVTIEKALGDKLETWFDDFDDKALASASIAQVHTARFNQSSPYAGQEVVLKVIRPNIQKQIEADIALMYLLAGWVPRLSADGRRLRPVEVVREYEKTIIEELDLRREMANAIRLRSNFEDSPMLYVPKMYGDFGHKNVIVMERIYGIQVSEIEKLKANGTNMQLLAERGVEVFFTQVFRDSFFHADMHPGNIFVNPEHPEDPQYIGIDCGIVGSLNREDKRYLAENFIAFFNRDYQRVAQLHVDSGWVPEDTNVQDFEQAIRTVCDPIFAKPLAEISFGHVLLNLFNTARRYNMEVQPQLILLQKTLLYIEGLGRQLYPELDLWKTAKPFLEKWVDEQIGVRAVIKNIRANLPYMREHFADLPNAFFSALNQQKQIARELQTLQKTVANKEQNSNKKTYYAIIGGVLVLGAILRFDELPTWLTTGLLASGAVVWLCGLTRKS